MRYFILAFLLILLQAPAYAQIEGCTDPNAVNFNPNATINDGSCQYDPTFFNPPVVLQLTDLLDETSGLIMYGGDLWSHNDSGGEASIYRIDTSSGAVIQEVHISGAKNVDWEDLAQDGNHIYIGDFGNNKGNRDDLTIYKIKKADIISGDNLSVAAEKIEFSYSDQKYAAKSRRENNFDCEAMIVADSIYLFSKNWGNKHTKLYSLPKAPGKYTARLITTYNIQGLVTAADMNTENNKIALCGYEEYVPFTFLLWDYSDNNFFEGNKRRIDFPLIFTAQTEGICFYDNSKAFISAEETQTLPQRVYRIDTEVWTAGGAEGIEPVFSEKIKFKIEPNPVSGRAFRIIVDKMPESDFKLQMYDSSGKTVYMGSYQLKHVDDQLNIKFVAPDYKKGLYVLKLSSGDHFATRKILIQ